MDDSNLLRISILVSTLGLVLLFFVSIHSQPSLVEVAGLTYDDVGSKVVVKGEVMSKSVKDGHIFIKISDGTGKILIAIFQNAAEKISEEKLGCIQVESIVEVAGEVNEYRGSLEIVPRDESAISCWKRQPSQ